MKIEAGCMAMIIKSIKGNEGKTVKVIQFRGATAAGIKDVWEVEPMFNANLPENKKWFGIEEKYLMRIDGFKPEILIKEYSLIGD